MFNTRPNEITTADGGRTLFAVSGVVDRRHRSLFMFASAHEHAAIKRVAIWLFPWMLLAGCSSVTAPSSTRSDSQGLLPSGTIWCPACGTVSTNSVVQKVATAPVYCPKCGELLEVPPPPPAATTRRAYAPADVQTNRPPVGAVTPDELERARNLLTGVRSDMPVKKVLATLGLSRFRGHATKCEGPTTMALRFKLANDHLLDLYYTRQTGGGWELSWVSVDEAYWEPARRQRYDNPYFSIDIKGYWPTNPPPVTEKELAFAAAHMTLLRPDMKVPQVLEALGLERFRGQFMFGGGSYSLSGHAELGSSHKLDLIYDYRVRPALPWELSWVALDWQDNQTGRAHWDAPKRTRE
jgi:hypothetical protein